MAAECDVDQATTDDDDGTTPLDTAAQQGHIDVVKTLPENGAEKSIRVRSTNETPLNVARVMGQNNIAALPNQYNTRSGIASQYSNKIYDVN